MLRTPSAPARLLAVCAALIVSACGADSTDTAPSQVAVSLSPDAAQVLPRAVIPFVATVSGSATTSVTWSVQGGAASGEITSTGVYTAPASTGQYIVVATSVADGTKSATANVTVVPSTAVAVTVSPKSRSVAVGGNAAFVAVVTGSNNTGVTWSVQGGSANGTITADGQYTAPGVPGTYTVVATSAADTSRTDTATVTVSAPGGTSLAAQLAVLSGKAIYFGHASVGENIIDGIWTLEASNTGPEPSVINQSGASASTVANALRPGVLYGNGWGISNGDLLPKIAIFDSTMRGGVGAKANIAMMKPCYSDFPGRSTPQEAFNAYVATINGLKALYPNVTFVHFTSPVSSVNPDNVNSYRQVYSNLIRGKYRGVEPLFDIAAVESTSPSGVQVLVDGSPAMYPGYTTDGGHLNATGQDVVARALVAYLASLP